ncbi:MAG: histidine phosphatase family protein [Caldilineales bacterium]|nr:histidine phosphatase family protein [Caldilineales bacterium]
MPTDLYLIRHGQTEANHARIWQGYRDWPLTELGWAQARAVAVRLARQGVTGLYSSDLGRALQTATVVAAATDLPITPHAGLRERSLGLFEGLSSAEIEARYPELWQRFRSGDPEFAIPGGESARQRLEQVLACLQEIVAAHAGQRVAVITHGGVLYNFFRHILGIPAATPGHFGVRNCTLNHFQHDETGWTLVTWGDGGHLEGLEA